MREKSNHIRYLVLTLLLVALLCVCFAFTASMIQEQSYTRCCEHIETVGLELAEGHLLKFNFRRNDGAGVCLRLFSNREYSEEKPEVFWFFEQLPE